MKLCLRGAEIPILGFYEAFPSQKSKPDISLDVTVVEGFELGREMTTGHPAFESHQCGADLFAFSRCNAEGTVRFAGDGSLEARFECALRPNTLEAIIRLVASIALPFRGALILHSSAIADDRGAQVFSGVSGAGKSTIAAMLASACAVQKVSDELVLVYRKEDQWTVGVSPFLGSENLAFGSDYPICAINFLQQWPSHRRTEVAKSQAMGELCKHVLTYTRGKLGFQAVLSGVAQLVTSVPCYQLQFAREPSVAEVLGITC